MIDHNSYEPDILSNVSCETEAYTETSDIYETTADAHHYRRPLVAARQALMQSYCKGKSEVQNSSDNEE